MAPGQGIAHRPPTSQARAAAIAALAILFLVLTSLGIENARPLLVVPGVVLGLTLYHATFGFAGAYRRLLVERDGTGVQAQLLMLAVASILFAPFLAHGTVFGREVAGAAAPAGLSVAIGAFLFGIGMQLGNACGSGTLYTLGGGRPRMLAVLTAFCAGGFWASLHMDFWQSLPAVGTLVLGESLGWPAATAFQLGTILLLSTLLRRWAPSHHPLFSRTGHGNSQWIRGPWAPGIGALVLALSNLAVLMLAGHPWTITWGFTLWGAKAASVLGWDATASAFWQSGFQRHALDGPVLADHTSLLNVSILIGAALAAALAGRFRPSLRIPPRSWAAAVLGGLIMGYGARIAYGCNVGAFFSGIASTSVHGWLWIGAAVLGTRLGISLRPAFGLDRS